MNTLTTSKVRENDEQLEQLAQKIHDEMCKIIHPTIIKLIDLMQKHKQESK